MGIASLSDRCDPSRAALVVVDVQVDFCRHPDASPEQWARMEQMAASLDQLITAAHAVSLPVIFVQTIHDIDSDSPSWRQRHGGELLGYEHELCKPGTVGAEYFRVKPLRDDIIVVKHRYDAFVGTDLDAVLSSLEIEAVILTGVMTDVCVETTLRHAVCLDYVSTIVSDCCAAATPEKHELALERVTQSFGRVASASEIATSWGINFRIDTLIDQVPSRR